MTWQLLARAPNRTVAGVLSAWQLKLTQRLNAVGSWQLTVPVEVTPSGWPAPGAGLIMVRDGDVVASGQLDDETFAWAADPSGGTGGSGTYTLTGDTDLGRLAYRDIYPTPGQPWDSQVNHSWQYPLAGTDTGEEVIRVTVNWQAGSLALTPRRVPGLRLGPTAGVGTQTVIRERFTPLLEALRKVALTTGGLVFDCKDALDGFFDFAVRAPVDRTQSTRFGIELGNVESLNVKRTSPEATVALVAGQGEGAARELVEIADPTAVAAWGRRELFVDQRQVDDEAPLADRLSEYQKAADDRFESSREQRTVTAVITDTPLVRWGRDYNLGDKVSVLTPFGPIEDLVREVDITVDETGMERVASAIGTADATAHPHPLSTTVRRLLRRISQLERGL